MARLIANRAAAGALLAGALAAFASAPVSAQGKSNQPHGHSTPPSKNPLPIAAAAPPGLGAMPIAWVDDANLMEAGAVAVDLSVSRWQGNGIGETDAPVTNITAGLSDRIQFTASIPHVVANDAAGVVGGLGTTYFGVKYAVYANDGVGFKLAVAPTLEVLGEGVLQSLGPTESRAQIGLPVSAEFDRDGRRFYASTGWFSRGVWFAGGGAGMQVSRHAGVSATLSHSWTSQPDISVPTRQRTEISGGASYQLLPHVTAFGSLGHTIATLDENGAGMTFVAGVSFYVSPPSPPRPQRRP